MTQVGRDALQYGLERLKAGQRLDVDLHPALAWTIRRQLLVGEFELAAFAALREVEIRGPRPGWLRRRTPRVALMANAFQPQRPRTARRLVGRTWCAGGDDGAVQRSHPYLQEPVVASSGDLRDPVLAPEVVLLADLLMRLLDRVEARKTGKP
jgi:hypothetical protein